MFGSITDITQRKLAEGMLQAIQNAQAQFIVSEQPSVIFEGLLDQVLFLTDSKFGFIGEVLRTSEGAPYLKSHWITNIAWNDETRELYNRMAPNLEFHNLDTLFGAVLKTGELVIANDPATDPRSGGLPEGHPPVHAFLGLPLYCGGRLVGMLGIANRLSGYDEEVVTMLEPLLTSCATLIDSYQNEQRRQQAVLALSQSEHKYRDVLANIPALVAVVDNEQRYQLINKQYEDFWGVSSEQIVGKTVREFVGESEYEQIKENIEAVLSGKTISFETERGSADGGKKRWLNVSYVPDRDQGGKIQGFYALLSDITERKHTQNQLRELSRQLRRAEEMEREKISRELHDEFGQLLTVLKMDLGWLDVELDQPQPINKTRFSDKFMGMRTVLNQAIDSVRRVATLLRPAVLDALGILPALEWLAKDFQERTGIVCVVSVVLPLGEKERKDPS